MNPPAIRKYIIAADPDGAEHAIIFAKELQHAAVCPPTLKPVSAGFIIFSGGQIHVPAIGSETLRLEPRTADKQLLEAMLDLN